jgi:DNA-directed RNA polymerase specialized sigma24 family protein
MGLATDEAVVARNYGMDDRAWQAAVDASKRRPLMSYESLELIITEDEVEPDRNYLAVRQAVARLPMPDRQIVTKAWMHGFTISRIAKEHRLTEAQVQAVLDARRPVLIQKLSHLV